MITLFYIPEQGCESLPLRHRRRADQITTCDSGRQGARYRSWDTLTLVQTEQARTSLYSLLHVCKREVDPESGDTVFET